jgi:glutamate carboxypeptidase
MENVRLQGLFEEIDRLTPEYVQFWKDICTLEARSDDVAGLNRVADLISARSEAHGLRVIREHHEGAGDPLVLVLPEKTAEGGAHFHGEFSEEDGPVSLLGHFDTVHPAGAFGSPAVREENGTLYGPGVFDMKCGVVMALFACEILRASGLPHREIRIVLDPDEESGEHLGEERKAFHLRHIKGSVAAINCEGSHPGCVTVGRKGVLRVAIDVTGVATHAGNAYFKGSSAIREAAYKIISLEKCSEESGMTFNVGRIEGGTVVNIIPEKCHMEVDIRFLSQEQLSEAYKVVDRVVRKITVPGCTASWHQLHLLEAMTETEGNHRLFDLYDRCARENGLGEYAPMFRGGGSDAAFPVLLGVPTICAAGPSGRFEHTIREEADIASLPLRTKILVATLLRI